MGRAFPMVSVVASAALAACSLFVDAGGLSGGDGPAADAGVDAAALAPVDAATASDAGTPGDAGDPTLEGEWLFDEIGASVAADTSGKGRSARFAGAARIAAGGFRGGALTLGGGADRAIVDALAEASFPPRGTLALRARYTFNPSDGQNRAIFDDWDVSRAHLYLRRANDGPAKSIQFALQDQSTTGYVTVTSRTLEPSTWAQFVVTWDAAAKESVLFVDRREVGRSTYSRAFSPSGQRFVLGTNWVGQIDEVRLWSRVLSGAEVAALD